MTGATRVPGGRVQWSGHGVFGWDELIGKRLLPLATPDSCFVDLFGVGGGCVVVKYQRPGRQGHRGMKQSVNTMVVRLSGLFISCVLAHGKAL